MIAEFGLDAPMRLAAAVGTHALALGEPGGQGGQGAIVLATTERGLTAHAFPARAIPTTAGAAGTQLVVALPGSVEEWDPQSRLPKRRLKLPRPAQVTGVGGSDRVVWLTTHDEPTRIDVLPLVNRGQPKVHELPEPIAHVASHPRSDTIACIGATSGRVFVVDLDGRAGMRIVGPEGIETVEALGLVVGRVAGVLAAQATRPLAVVSIEPVDEDAQVDAPATTVTPSPDIEPAPPRPAARRSTQPPPIQPAQLTATPAAHLAATPAPARPAHASAVAEFRDRVANPRAMTIAPVPPLWPEAQATWREDIAAWTRSIVDHREPIAAAAPHSLPIDALITRYDLTAPLGDALALLYGAYLLGERGVAPLAMARVAGWPDALGRGELADKQLVVYGDARVELAGTVRRVLDELPPTTGTLVGTPGAMSLLGPCVLVAAGPLHIVAEACVSSIGGAILAAHDSAHESARDAARNDDPHALIAEARAYGAAPMLRARAGVLAQLPVDQPLILVADDDRTANELGLPRLR
jgi:hypothetical protein